MPAWKCQPAWRDKLAAGHPICAAIRQAMAPRFWPRLDGSQRCRACGCTPWQGRLTYGRIINAWRRVEVFLHAHCCNLLLDDAEWEPVTLQRQSNGQRAVPGKWQFKIRALQPRLPRSRRTQQCQPASVSPLRARSNRLPNVRQLLDRAGQLRRLPVACLTLSSTNTASPLLCETVTCLRAGCNAHTATSEGFAKVEPSLSRLVAAGKVSICKGALNGT